MRRKVLTLVAMLSIGLWLAGCGQPEEQVSEETAPMEDLPSKPEVGSTVLIPAGEFTMGTDNDPHNLKLAEPAHAVDLPAFEIGVYEVTNGEFARFQLDSDYSAEGDWRSYYKIGREDFPVANVTFEDAKAYCEWAGMRLPTEAEWEKAARGTEQLRYPWGDVFDFTFANTNEHGVRDTMEVGSFERDKSPHGVYDMMGNVQEWTASSLQAYPGAKPPDPSVFRRNVIVVRGASYAMKGGSMYLFSRTGAPPGAQWGYGFRCVRDVGE